MKKTLLISILLLLTNICLIAQDQVIRIVVLGSSTAAGTGPSNISFAWVNQYRDFVQSINPTSEVINLAKGGYTTYNIMPSDYTPPSGAPVPDPTRNITTALSLHPDVIIINMPSNDVSNGFPVTATLSNYDMILSKANSFKVPVYITTTQPVNTTQDKIQKLMDIRDSTLTRYGDRAIDFWSDIATAQGTVNPIYDSGDGLHLNNAAHTILKNRVIDKDIVNKYSRSDNDVDTIELDLGTSLSSGGWNNLQDPRQDTIYNLVNKEQQSTGISIWINDAFNGVNTNGTSSPNASLNLPASATSDSFYGNEVVFEGATEPTAGLTLSDLSQDKKYSFTFFASRNGVTDNREAKYVVIGNSIDSVYLDAANNSAKNYLFCQSAFSMVDAPYCRAVVRPVPSSR